MFLGKFPVAYRGTLAARVNTGGGAGRTAKTGWQRTNVHLSCRLLRRARV